MSYVFKKMKGRYLLKIKPIVAIQRILTQYIRDEGGELVESYTKGENNAKRFQT